jgi:hypothetical protein
MARIVPSTVVTLPIVTSWWSLISGFVPLKRSYATSVAVELRRSRTGLHCGGEHCGGNEALEPDWQEVVMEKSVRVSVRFGCRATKGILLHERNTNEPG